MCFLGFDFQVIVYTSDLSKMDLFLGGNVSMFVLVYGSFFANPSLGWFTWVCFFFGRRGCILRPFEGHCLIGFMQGTKI